MDGLEIDGTRFAEMISRTMQYTSRTMEEELRSQAKGVMKEVIAVTPPRGNRGSFSSPRTAEKGARGKMATDLIGGSGTGKRGGRRAGVFTVLSDSLIDSAIETDTYETENVRLWVRKDGTVYGTQRRFFRPDASMAEMRAHHKRYFVNGKMSTAGTYERGIGRWKWLDQMIVRRSTFDRYLNQESKMIGFYSGGWAPAARALGVPMPAYLRRHAGTTPGSVRILIGDRRMTIQFENAANYGSVDRDMQRRLQWAVDVQANKMERRLPFLMRHAAKMGGFQTT